MFLKITDSSVHDCSSSAAVFGTGAHQASVNGIDNIRWRRDEENRSGWNRIDLFAGSNGFNEKMNQCSIVNSEFGSTQHIATAEFQAVSICTSNMTIFEKR